MRIETVKRLRNSMEEECTSGYDENSDMKVDINDYRKDLGMREAQLNNDLRPRARALEAELAECEERSESQIRELQRLKSSCNEQLNKNANLMDDMNQLEIELTSVNYFINKFDLKSTNLF